MIAWTRAQQIPVDKVVVELGSVLNRQHRRFHALCRFGWECVQAALGRELVVMVAAEVDDDFVRDVEQALTRMCARLYGKRATENRAERAPASAVIDGRETA